MSSVKNTKVNEYINEVCSLIKNKKVHAEIKEELLSHIEDIIYDSIQSGISLDAAIDKALLQMGSAEVIGRDLNKAHKCNSDWILLTMTSALIFFGFLTTGFLQFNSFTLTEDYSPNYFGKLLVFLGVSIVLALLSLKLDYRKLKNYSLSLYIFNIILIVLTLFLSPYVNGMRRWLFIGSLSIDTLTITPILLIVSLAGIFDSYNWNNRKSLIKGFTLVFIPSMLFLATSSISTTLIYLIASFTVMHISGLKTKHLVMTFSFFATIFSLAIFSGPYYRKDRFFAFLNPLKDSEGSRWIYNQLNTIRNSATLFGNSININSNFIPDSNMEFVLTSIIYCFGWIVGIIIIALVLSFIIRMFFISINTKNTYGKLLVSGLCSLFTIQFILNILANFSLSPILGISMPFISYGGSQLVINVVAISIINNVYKFRNTHSELSN